MHKCYCGDPFIIKGPKAFYKIKKEYIGCENGHWSEIKYSIFGNIRSIELKFLTFDGFINERTKI